MTNAQNIALQTMCRYYLTKLKGIASKYGIDWFLDDAALKALELSDKYRPMYEEMKNKRKEKEKNNE